MTAPSTALGRSAIGPVRNSRTSATSRRREQPGHLAAGAHRVVDRRARPARAHRQALRERGRGVRGAHGDELLPDADVLVAAARERARGEDLVGEAHEEQADRAGGDGGEVLQRREARCGQARRDLADRRDVEVEPGGGDDRRRSRRRARPGSAARGSAAGMSRTSAAAETASVVPLHGAEFADDLRQLGQRVARGDVQPEQLAELADHEHDRDAVDVARRGRAARSSPRPSRAGARGRDRSRRRRAAPSRPRAPPPPRSRPPPARGRSPRRAPTTTLPARRSAAGSSRETHTPRRARAARTGR